jgi:hypothetical protein
MLKQLDMGYETVEVNPTDGYRPCECENCVKLFGVDDPGEKLWLLHRKLAERLLKDRPGKKIMLCAYGPTIEPPKTFKSFPDNVTIELCGYSPEYFDKWKDFKVACGYSVYSYNWGTYHVIGVTPKRSPKFCSDQIKLFKDKNIHGIYRCGFGEFPGMEGPAYYVFGKAMGDPDGAGAAPLAEEFYRLAYGEAAAPMRAFFEALNPRLDAYAALENGGALPSNPRVALAMIYSPDVLISMGKNLERAKTLASNPKVKQRVALVEKEFEYVKNLAEIIHLHNAYSLRTNKQNFDQLAAEIDKRNAMINSLYDGNGKMRQFPGWPEINLFRGERKDRLLSNGFLSGKIGAPLNWSTETLRKSGLLPGQGKKSIKIRMAKEPVSMDGNLDAGAWKDAEFNDIGELQMGAVSDKTMFKALYDNENIYMGVSAWLPEPGEYTVRGHDGSCWSQECVEIFIDPFGSREKYFHFIYNPVDNSCYEESFGFITDPLDIRYGKPDVSWNGKWEYKNSLGSGKWNSVVKIPFSSLGVKKPEKGAVWCVNIGREHYRTGKPTEYSLWSPNFETINFCDSGAFGEIAFEP